VHAQLHVARRKLATGLRGYYPFGPDGEEGVPP
jgi:hypothetical protein